MVLFLKFIQSSLSSLRIKSLTRAERCRRVIAAKKELWELLGITKLHGCYRLYAGKTYAKVFWLIVMIGAAVFFSEVVIKLVYQYTNRNVNTQVEIVYEEAEDPMTTICSYNVLRKSYIEELMKTKGFSFDLLNYILYLYSPLENFHSEGTAEQMQVGQSLLDDFTANNPGFNLFSFISNASQRCDDFILKCFYENMEFDCCDPKFTRPVMTDMGQCYTTSLSELRRLLKPQRQFGVTQGLEMLLDYRTDDEVPAQNMSGLLVKPPFLNIFEKGFRIYIHDDLAVPIMGTEMVSVSPNNKIAIALRPTKYHFLERSFGGACRSSWPGGYDDRVEYSETLCEALCIAHYFIRTCGCTPLRFDVLRTGNTCNPKQIYECMEHKFPGSGRIGTPHLMPDCNECAPQCNNFIYYAHNSYANGILKSTVQYLEKLDSRFTPEYVRQNVVGLHVFFQGTSFVLYSQSRLSDLTNVLSNIGGNMGLFLGASVLSLFELAVFAFKTSWSLFSAKRAKYAESKHIQEDARKKRLEELLNNSEIHKEVSPATSQTSEELVSEESSSERTAKKPDNVEALSVESLDTITACQYVEPRRRARTVSLFLTRELAESLLKSRSDSESSVCVAYTNNKLVVPRRIGRSRVFTVI